MQTAATDALAKSDSSSPLKSVSWSSQTVEQFDDRCVQISIDALKELIGGKGVKDEDKGRLKNFQSVHIENLPDNSESSKYRPLCNILNIVELIAGSDYRWKIVANLGESSEVDHRPDLARYPINIKEAKAAYRRKVKHPAFMNIARCAWAWMASFIEVKNNEEFSGFFFSLIPDENGEIPFLRNTEKAKIARAQFIKYATEALLRQHRTHYYSFYIAGMAVRVFRWDRVGCLVSEPIDLAADHVTFLDILHRLATAEDNYGADDTVVRATSADIGPVREFKTTNDDLRDYQEMMLDDLESYPIYKVSCPTVDLDAPEGSAEGASAGERTYLIGRYAFGHYAVFGRCTRGYAAWDVAARRFVWFKDQWRCVTRPYTELAAYVRLHAHKVAFIATPVAGGDLVGQCTQSQRYMTRVPAEWRPAQRVHTRLVTKEVGKLVETYADSPHLLRICCHAFIGHTQAYERARILHRDISIGNIMINVEDGYGFLNDWDLCKFREDLESGAPASEPSGISGTWAFKSAFSLEYPRKPPEVADDMESFVNVLTFFAFRYHHHKHSPVAENTDSEAQQKQAASENNGLMGFVNGFFYEQRKVGRGFYQGGATKRIFIDFGKPPVVLRDLKNGRRPLIATFLDAAYKLLNEHYSATEADRYKEYIVRKNDAASADEDHAAPPDGPPGAAQGKIEGPQFNSEEKDEAYRKWMAQAGWNGDDSDCESGDGDDLDDFMPQGPPVPLVPNPQRCLDDHRALGVLFRRLLDRKDGQRRDLTAFGHDKRFDQFRSWHEFGWTPRRLRCGEHRLGSRESNKRSRDDDDDADADGEGPAAKKASPPCEQPEAAALKAARGKTVAAKKAPAKAQPKTAKAAPGKRAAPRKAAKGAPAKTVVKATTTRKAVKLREPGSPRRATAVKAEVTKKTVVVARVEAAPAARRSQRLAAKRA
ncbi:hypothetical protein PsYK624_026500 [Phanerochaete sordida]|uniref:Fungal-type protein kinase domain-containing protein n=1 Tax=Phanerochaete sordida TaxID=48140 RepID=A0A9P3G288_9APHY|nr:hypothetical protein PsYK624_026500 [Phanerochaete sordida]